MADCSDLTPRSVLVVAHDAGGANQLFYRCAAQVRTIQFYFYLSGPALTLWASAPQSGRLVETPCDTDCVITGTGWQSDFERSAIARAKAVGRPVAAYLDYWANYRERFLEPSGNLILPDALWVPDREARDVARQAFKDEGLPDIRVVPNLYWHHIVKRVQRKSARVSEPALLVALEPIRLPGVNVSSLYDRVVAWIETRFRAGTTVVLRPHPSGSADALERLHHSLHRRFQVHTSAQDLATDLAQCSDVIGFQSSVLPLALKCRRRAWSFFPASSLPRLLPHQGIEYLPECLP